MAIFNSFLYVYQRVPSTRLFLKGSAWLSSHLDSGTPCPAPWTNSERSSRRGNSKRLFNFTWSSAVEQRKNQVTRGLENRYIVGILSGIYIYIYIWKFQHVMSTTLHVPARSLTMLAWYPLPCMPEGPLVPIAGPDRNVWRDGKTVTLVRVSIWLVRVFIPITTQLNTSTPSTISAW